MTDLLKLILGVLASLFKSRAALESEIVILRQQINVLRRHAPKRPHLNNTDRFLFVWLYHLVPLRCPFRKLYPDVSVMQSSQDGNGGNFSDPLDGSL